MGRSALTFAYKSVNGNLRPLIPIEIQKGAKATVRLIVLVDSGADVCIFWGEVGGSTRD